jgi:excisionase family DNA binding protein
MNDAVNSVGAGKFLSVNQTARILGVHHTTIRRWIKGGTLSSIKVGGRIKISGAAVDSLTRRGFTKTNDQDRIDEVAQRVRALENSVHMLLDELGYGSYRTGYTHDEIRTLLTQATTLLKKPLWGFSEMNTWAETLLTLRDDDILRMTNRWGEDWVPLYSLAQQMLRRVAGDGEAEKVLRAKLDKAIGHLRSCVYACSRVTDPATKLKGDLARISSKILAESAPMTARLASYFSAAA